MFRFLILALLLLHTSAIAQSLEECGVPRPISAGQPLAIGFLGAWERWDDPNRGVRKLALDLRRQGIAAETFGNHNLRTAKKAVLAALDTDGNHKIGREEAAKARIVLFGQSMGGGAVVKLAQFLQKRNIPVLLTVQVDSWGAHDDLIPSNVQAAANYYQAGLLTFRGEDKIRAADPGRTQILGNFEYHYPLWIPSPRPESWARRTFGGGHARMEADPLLWSGIESLILEIVRTRQEL